MNSPESRHAPEVRLSVIIPTCGRLTLARTLESVAAADLRSEDEVLVAPDGPQPVAEAIVRSCSPQMRISLVAAPRTSCFGNVQRQEAMKVATGTHLVFIDDDDVYEPGALGVMRAAAADHPENIILFRMASRHLGVLWECPEVISGNVSTQMFLIPNRQELLGTWGNRYEGDYDFLRGTLDRWPGGEGAVVWRDEVLVKCY